MVIKKQFNLNKRIINLIATKLRLNYQKSEQVYLNVLEEIKNKLKGNPLVILREVIERLAPPLRTKPKKIAGRVYRCQLS